MALRLDYVQGVSPAKWLRAWADRRPDLPLEARRVDESAQLDAVRAGEADLAFVRLPVDEQGLHRIPLWEEVAVAALPKDHDLADAESITLADLADIPHAPVQDDPAMTMELVGAGTGYAIVPHSIARLHHRKDVVAVPVSDAPPTRIALVWRVDRDDADIQEFVGVVRGRSARSSRGSDVSDAPGETDASKPTPKRANGAGSKHPAKGKGAGTGGKPARPTRPRGTRRGPQPKRKRR
ncbi:LysR family substrate-binding domain-containing protein [Agromyces larvae]|uniref:LysR family substrate-binding domain-containing protein n=1 Tax=Agromyces larvae TaxID=2929802 RepID=A0ABY4BTZ2_9MICO|nr:LysR family substrate-binding domain-containing protein [Agromyces larvae]UOE42678.1 LysR family substrate-binding domain-containing protein [Agromyces larvae]